jgi:hypothetical protein
MPGRRRVQPVLRPAEWGRKITSNWIESDPPGEKPQPGSPARSGGGRHDRGACDYCVAIVGMAAWGYQEMMMMMGHSSVPSDGNE